jgi:hypothetical protein
MEHDARTSVPNAMNNSCFFIGRNKIEKVNKKKGYKIVEIIGLQKEKTDEG